MNLNHDLLGSLRFDLVAQEAYGVLDQVQRIRPPELQVAAVLLLAMVLSEECGARLPDVLTKLDNLSRDSSRHLLPNVAAMRDYWRMEVLKT